MTLNQLPPGKTAVIRQISVPQALRCRLLDLGMVPGTRVKVRKYAPFGDPIELSLRGYTLVIRREAAERITIRPLSGSGQESAVHAAPRSAPEGTARCRLAVLLIRS